MKNFNLSNRSLGKVLVIPALLTLGLSSQALAYVQLTAQVAPGATNANVSNLQEFLAATPDFYPQGLVTGYYGALTTAAVQKFQAFYGIVSSGSPATTGFGRVGPSTLAKINSIIAGGSTSLDVTGPAIGMQYQPQVTGTTALFNWSTNESATGRVYYITSPLQMNEGDIRSNGFAVTSGQVGSFHTIARMGQSSSVTGLMPNTTYYYTIVATDLNGNVSVVGPNNTFRTSAQ